MPPLSTPSAETVAVSFRLPERAALMGDDAEAAEIMDAYQLKAVALGCAHPALNVTQAYAERGDLALDAACDWQLTLALGSAPRENHASAVLSATYYESAAFSLRRSDLIGKARVEVLFNLKRQAAGAAAGFTRVLTLK